jgi:four helix bundle protein
VAVRSEEWRVASGEWGERESFLGKNTEMAVKDYRQLIVWQRAMDLVESVYRLTTRYPKEELYGLTSQTRRASVSVPSNIAEGQGRQTTADFMHFLAIARGSLKELETQVIIARRLGYVTAEDEAQLLGKADDVSRLLSGLKRSLARKIER